MRSRQTSLSTVINVTTSIVLLYLIAVLVAPWPLIAFGLFSAALIATAWMAIRILKDPYSTDKRFGKQFYQDRDDIRRNLME